MDVRVGLWRKLSAEELMLLNCGIGEDSWDSPLDCKEIQPVHSEGDPPWDFFGRNDAKAETPVLWPPHAKSWLNWKDSDAGRDWGQEEKGMTEDEMIGWSLTRWTWVWVNSGSWWWTGRPGVLRFMGSQRVGHDWATELNWKFLISPSYFNEILAGYRNLGCSLFSFITLSMSCHSLLAWRVLLKDQLLSLWESPCVFVVFPLLLLILVFVFELH